MESWELYEKEKPFEDLILETLTAIEKNDDGDRLTFKTLSGREFVMYHSQDCCEHVTVEEIIGDLEDVIGEPLLMAECVSSSEPDDITKWKRAKEKEEYEKQHGKDSYYTGNDSETWTFYKLATKKGFVTIRWYGSSNGYYSESVQFAETSEPIDL